MSRRHPQEQSRSFVRYMPVSGRMREWGFAVTNAGHSTIVPGSPYPPMRHPSHHHFTWSTGRVLTSPSFIYVTQGRGMLETSVAGEREVQAGDVMVLIPGIWHRYKPRSETGWHEYWIDFEGPVAERQFALAGFDPSQPLVHTGLDEELVEAFSHLVELTRTEPFRMELLLCAEGMRILCRVTALMETRQLGTPSDAAAISRAKAMLLEGTRPTTDLAALARDLGMSYTSFRRLFKASTGFSPRQFQLEHTLHRAKAMLGHSPLPIGGISDALGFDSLFYFSQFFKKRTGLAPSAFRRLSHAPQPHRQ